MGVDSKLFIAPQYDEYDVMDALEKMGYENVRFDRQISGAYTFIRFESKQFKGEPRSLGFFPNTGDQSIGLPSNTLSFSSNEESHEILTKLAKMYGGVLQKNDCTDEFEAFQRKTQDLEWYVKRFINEKGLDMPSRGKDQAALFISFLQEQAKKA